VKLDWEQGKPGEWKAEGKSYSYDITTVKYDSRIACYQVEKTRQPGGQLVDRVNTASLDGAFARAQVWENRENR
jgi:hypothetical protein